MKAARHYDVVQDLLFCDVGTFFLTPLIQNHSPRMHGSDAQCHYPGQPQRYCQYPAAVTPPTVCQARTTANDIPDAVTA